MNPLDVLVRAKKILVFFAHPDDEILIIPGLLDLCQGRQVKVLYATASGANPADAVRLAELAGSAAKYGFTAVPVGLPTAIGTPTSAQQDALWDAASGGSVRELIANEVRAFKPDAIITFDPRHGTTALPGGDPLGEHLLLGRLVLQALACTYPRDKIVMLAHTLEINGQFIGFRPAYPNDPDSYNYPVGHLWDHVTGLMEHYKSQFNCDWVTRAKAAPDHMRTISLKLASTFPKEPA